MGYKLTGDQLRSASRKLGDIARQIGQEEYPHYPEYLLEALQAIGEGRFWTRVCRFPSEILAQTLIPQGFSVIEDVEPSEFDATDLEYISFLREKEEICYVNEIRTRAVALGANLGLVDGKRIFDQRDNFPEAARTSHLLLPGTLLRDIHNDLYIMILLWQYNNMLARPVNIHTTHGTGGMLARIKQTDK